MLKEDQKKRNNNSCRKIAPISVAWERNLALQQHKKEDAGMAASTMGENLKVLDQRHRKRDVSARLLRALAQRRQTTQPVQTLQEPQRPSRAGHGNLGQAEADARRAARPGYDSGHQCMRCLASEGPGSCQASLLREKAPAEQFGASLP